MGLVSRIKELYTPKHMKVRSNEIWVSKSNPSTWLKVKSVNESPLGDYLNFDGGTWYGVKDYMNLDLFLVMFKKDKERSQVSKVLYG